MPQSRRSSGHGSGGIKTHPLVEALAPDPAQPAQRTTRLFGYPGPAAEPDSTRLYLDPDLTSYVDVPNDAIRHSQTLENDAGTILWVDPRATLAHTTTQSHQVQADFLSGAITDQNLAGAPVAGGPVIQPTPTALPTHFIGCHTLIAINCWQTETCVPTRIGPCMSHRPVCFVSEGCQPTHVGPCLSRAVSACVRCPSGVVVCIPSVEAAGCPSRICPSATIPCQSIPACPTAVCPQTIACGGAGGPVE